jgi:hypothetical protein
VSRNFECPSISNQNTLTFNPPSIRNSREQRVRGSVHMGSVLKDVLRPVSRPNLAQHNIAVTRTWSAWF